MRAKRGFASDNNAGVHARVLDAVRSANQGHTLAYGDDIYTETAVKKFREQFGEGVEVFFVFGGTGANVSGLASVARPHHAVVCAETAQDRKSTRLNSSHANISYAVFCLKKKKK